MSLNFGNRSGINNLSNKMHDIIPKLNECLPSSRSNRREKAAILSLLHIGRSFMSVSLGEEMEIGRLSSLNYHFQNTVVEVFVLTYFNFFFFF